MDGCFGTTENGNYFSFGHQVCIVERTLLIPSGDYVTGMGVRQVGSKTNLINPYIWRCACLLIEKGQKIGLLQEARQNSQSVGQLTNLEYLNKVIS